MAFNFNWSPLTADASFYTRAQELLTTALNKSPKPPIIVDDILVNELNLGSVPPDLEILEIGDLAEDRFRGIFKMCYSGDAFLTLKTRVQANPLNTYLSTKPSFASPQPLAAASGLTIPLKITLSDIKLSAFIILVFSRQKGLTLVFRNDPLESLKVSSTFDSIPFVRDYLQNEIEGQLRTLLMDEVPAIIHRLSLRLWVPEYRAREDAELARSAENPGADEKVTDPLASPPQDPVDLSGHVLDAAQIASLSLDSSAETHSLFSQKNLLRLATLTDSQRTLSLFTPGMRDVVFRAWAGPMERGEIPGSSTPITPFQATLARKHSYGLSTGTTYSFSESSDAASHATRPALSAYGSSATGLSLGSSKLGKPHRKRKHRVVNLRKPKTKLDDIESLSGESSKSATLSSATSESGFSHAILQDREGELVTPPSSPSGRSYFHKSPDRLDPSEAPLHLQDLTPRQPTRDFQPTPTAEPKLSPSSYTQTEPQQEPKHYPPKRPSLHSSRFFQSFQYPVERPKAGFSSLTAEPQTSSSAPYPYVAADSVTGGIMEQAFMLKMASEIARRVRDEKAVEGSFWNQGEREETPPPAYGV